MEVVAVEKLGWLNVCTLVNICAGARPSELIRPRGSWSCNSRKDHSVHWSLSEDVAFQKELEHPLCPACHLDCSRARHIYTLRTNNSHVTVFHHAILNVDVNQFGRRWPKVACGATWLRNCVLNRLTRRWPAVTCGQRPPVVTSGVLCINSVHPFSSTYDFIDKSRHNYATGHLWSPPAYKQLRITSHLSSPRASSAGHLWSVAGPVG